MKIVNQLLFPLLTIPYISRILGAEGVGVVEYYIAIAAYGLLISGFGLSQYSSIEMAKLRENNSQMKQEVISTFSFQLLLTVLGGIVFLCISLLLGISDYWMISIFLFKILLNLFRVEWYFIATENFKYIALRDLVVKLSFLLIIFVFITQKEDIYYYALALVLGDGIANLFNIRKMIKELNINMIGLFYINRKSLLKLYRGSFPFFFSALAITIYITMDKIMIGQMIGQNYVGYYSVSDRLVRIAMGVALALATVITPRLAYYYKVDKNKYFHLLNTSIKFILMLTFPMFVAIFIMAEDIIILVFGKEFLPAVLTLKILSIYLIIVPFANILGLQILQVIGKANKYTLSVWLAAIFNIILNYFLIIEYKHNGAAVASIVAEILGVSLQVYFVRKVFQLNKIFDRKLLYYILASIIMGICILWVGSLNLDRVYRVIAQISIGLISYFTTLLLLKDPMIIDYIRKYRGKAHE